MDGGEPGKRLWELPEAVHRVDVGGSDPLVPEKRREREKEREREERKRKEAKREERDKGRERERSRGRKTKALLLPLSRASNGSKKGRVFAKGCFCLQCFPSEWK